MSALPEEVGDEYKVPRELEAIINEYAYPHIFPISFYVKFLDLCNWEHEKNYTMLDVMNKLDENVIKYIDAVRYVILDKELDIGKKREYDENEETIMIDMYNIFVSRVIIDTLYDFNIIEEYGYIDFTSEGFDDLFLEYKDYVME